MKYKIAVIGAVTIAAALFAAAIYRIYTESPKVSGIVYADLNGNGEHDSGEAGIPDIAVSNGRRVVLTDKQGRYRLPLAEAKTVFVIKPSGYRLSLDSLRKPRFYHHVDKSENAGPAAEGAYDFALMPEQASDEDFSILVFGDPQPYDTQHVEYYKKDIISDVQDPGQYRFGISLGDIVGDRPGLYQPLAQATSRLGIPWWYVIGNHDLEKGTHDEDSARKSFRDFFGPTAYAFNEGQVHFIVLDSMKWIGPDSRNFVGGLSEQQLEFIEADLQHVPKDRLVVLAMHIPPLGEWVFQGKFLLADRKRLFELLAGREVLTLAAHTHTQWRLDFDGANGWESTEPHHLYIVGTTSGDWWKGILSEHGLPDATMADGTPNGYAVIHFDGRQYRLDWKVAGQPDEYRMRVYGPAAITTSAEPSGQAQERYFYVNYFMGYYSTSHVATPVEYREPGGQWKPMVPSFEADPYRLGLEYPWHQARWQGEEKPPGTQPKGTVPSLHLWKAKVPAHADPGKRVLQIRATETDGRQFFGEYRYEIIPAPQPAP